MHQLKEKRKFLVIEWKDSNITNVRIISIKTVAELHELMINKYKVERENYSVYPLSALGNWSIF